MFASARVEIVCGFSFEVGRLSSGTLRWPLLRVSVNFLEPSEWVLFGGRRAEPSCGCWAGSLDRRVRLSARLLPAGSV